MEDPEPQSEDGAEPQLNAALTRGLMVLKCFSTLDQELTSRELMERTGLTRQTVFRITNTLRREGLLRYSEPRFTFMLTPRVLTIGASVLSRLTLRQIARPLMQDLADTAKGQVMLSIGDGLDLVVVEVAQCPNCPVFRLEVGTRLSLSRTAPGISYLLALPEAQRDQYVARTLQADRERGRRLEAKLAEAAAALKERGFCVLQSELRREIVGVAVSMRTRADNQLFTFSCAILPFSADEQRLDELGIHLLSLVRNVEASLGDVGDISPSSYELS
jgi:DNA-binding IclR family transcriptional regulator